MLFPSPVSGEVVEIVRGAKRKIVAFKVLGDKEQQFHDFGIKDVIAMDREGVKAHLLNAGCWPFIRQRPYDIIANPEVTPKAIFVSAYASAPLAADYDYVLRGKEKELQAAVTALSKLTTGAVHVSVDGKSSTSVFSELTDIHVHRVTGPHPAGNVSVQIATISPINKGEHVWVVTPQDLVIIGGLFLTGKYNAERIVALAGSSIKNPKYYKTTIGAEVATFVYDAGVSETNIRVISGNVLTGTDIKPDGYLGYYDTTVTVIPEGNDYEFFGWNKPIFNKVSTSRALTFSWLFPDKKYTLNTNTNGEHRAFVLGAYEIAPEDFALTEFVCVSKQPHQEIIRQGLDLMYKEIG